MPRTQAANDEVREATRQTLLEAAVRLFARQGYSATSIRALASEAGVALGLLYHYFPSKEAVLEALLADGMADVEVTFEAARQGVTAADFVRALLWSAGERLKAHRSAWQVSYGLRHQPQVVEGLAGTLEKSRKHMLSFLEAELRRRDVPNARIEAEVLFATVEGIGQQLVQRPRAYPLEEVIDTVASRYARRRTR
ncbi:MAG: helix-turn-helix domain-containing protein [Archangium sp.]|nr:helix-turn-helix domain-containing protein [Archangium sp.]MDP3575009.1 helix-turn-helix domain-containing protein [Archangium sp.]